MLSSSGLQATCVGGNPLNRPLAINGIFMEIGNEAGRARVTNPFRYGELVSREDYCPRPAQERAFAEVVMSGQNSAVVGDALCGKSSFVCSVGRQCFGDRFLRVDLSGILDSEGFSDRLVRAFSSSIRDLDPVGMSDHPGLPVHDSLGVELWLDWMDEWDSGEPGLLFLDGFEDILQLDETRKVQGLLRGKVQFMRSSVVFAGRSDKGMSSLFADYQSPFYQAARLFRLDPIPVDAFKVFLCGKFSLCGFSVTPEFWDQLGVESGWVPGYVQRLCAMVWTLATKHVLDADDCQSAHRAVSGS